MSVSQLTAAQQVGARIAQERRLKAARDRRDIDQRALAKVARVSASTVSRWEDGSTVPKDDAIRRLALFFGVTPGWLRYGEGEREPIMARASDDAETMAGEVEVVATKPTRPSNADARRGKRLGGR